MRPPDDFAEREGFFLRCAAKATEVDCEPIGVLAACLSVKTKKNTARVLFLVFAEREGFEPPVPLSTPVFKTGVIDHSTISPERGNPQLWCKDTTKSGM